MMIKFQQHTNPLMSSRLRLYVPLPVLTISLTLAAAIIASLDSESYQFWLTNHSSSHKLVNQNINDSVDIFAYCVDQSTVCFCPVMLN